MPYTNADVVPILGLDRSQLVEQHIGGLRLRHSYDSHLFTDDDSGRLSLEDLSLAYGPRRASAPALGRLSSADRPSSARRWPLSTRSSSLGLSLTSSPDHELVNTRVRLVSVSPCVDHCEFAVHVETGKDDFIVCKRYSQFRDLRLQLLADLRSRHHCQHGACLQLDQIAAVKFPRRTMQLLRLGKPDLNTARGRVARLQLFVEAILDVYRSVPRRQVRRCLNEDCKVLADIRRFLDLCPSVEVDSAPEVQMLPLIDLPPKTNDSLELLSTISEGRETVLMQ